MKQRSPNTARADAIAARQELVARLRLQGMTLREIQRVLMEKGIINTETQNPVSFATVQRDVDALRQRWRAEAMKDTTEHAARQLAEIEQVRRKAWADGDLTVILRALELEMKLLGTAAPERVEMTGMVAGAVKLYAVENSPDLWDADAPGAPMMIAPTSRQFEDENS